MEMNVTEQINKFVEENGGNERDALNVALTRLDQKQRAIELHEAEIAQLKARIKSLKADLEMVGAGF